jgi:hypothetical protein
VSTATIGSAPASAAPITADSPTPPQPTMQVGAPGGTWAVFTTAPIPVATAQPINAATSGGTAAEIGTQAAAGTTAASAMVPIARYWYTRVPSARRTRVLPSASTCRPALVCSHSQVRPRTHTGHSPHGYTQLSTTRSPGRTEVTSPPTDTTTPAPSWPITTGIGRAHSPSTTCRSEWQTPLAR